MQKKIIFLGFIASVIVACSAEFSILNSIPSKEHSTWQRHMQVEQVEERDVYQWKDMPANKKVYVPGTPSDWSPYSAIEVTIHSTKTIKSSIYLVAYSENEEIDGHDYYKYPFQIDWIGWKTVLIPLKNFSSVRHPLGWDAIGKLYLAAHWGGDVDPEAVLSFSRIRLIKSTELSSLFSSHMIIQRDAKINLWGWDNPGTQIKATLNISDQKIEGEGIADASGRFQIELPSQPAGGPYNLSVKGTTRVELDDVLIGDIWLCSGQSNMGWTLEKSFRAKEEIPKANHPNIRLYKVPRKIAMTPQSRLGGNWENCSPQTAPSFSAVAYHFGRSLQNHLDIPVGLIMCEKGGTRIQTWLSPSIVSNHPGLAKVRSERDKQYANMEKITKEYTAWEDLRRVLKSEDREDELPKKKPFRTHSVTSVLFNGMVNPITSLPIKGLIWYQGESNTYASEAYETYFSALISDWRSQWNQPNLPVYFVQLPNYGKRNESLKTPSKWVVLREAQAKTSAISNTHMIVTIDLGEADNIHPRHKLEVGERLANMALNKTYSAKIPFSGPRFQHMTVHDSSIQLAFEEVSGELKSSAEDSALSGFQIAGSDQRFFRANAEVKGKHIIVSHPTIKSPIAVRYAYEANPHCTLTDGTGLPAAPFRTDTWNL